MEQLLMISSRNIKGIKKKEKIFLSFLIFIMMGVKNWTNRLIWTECVECNVCERFDDD